MKKEIGFCLCLVVLSACGNNLPNGYIATNSPLQNALLGTNDTIASRWVKSTSACIPGTGMMGTGTSTSIIPGTAQGAAAASSYVVEAALGTKNGAYIMELVIYNVSTAALGTGTVSVIPKSTAVALATLPAVLPQCKIEPSTMPGVSAPSNVSVGAVCTSDSNATVGLPVGPVSIGLSESSFVITGPVSSCSSGQGTATFVRVAV